MCRHVHYCIRSLGAVSLLCHLKPCMWAPLSSVRTCLHRSPSPHAFMGTLTPLKHSSKASSGHACLCAYETAGGPTNCILLCTRSCCSMAGATTCLDMSQIRLHVRGVLHTQGLPALMQTMSDWRQPEPISQQAIDLYLTEIQAD